MFQPRPPAGLVLLVTLALPGLARAQGDAAPAKREAAGQATGPAPQEHSIWASHSIEIDGRPLTYVSAAETLLLRDEAGQPEAEFFAISYLVESEDAAEEAHDGAAAARPITFAFNGGPGSSSVWLHMGLLGPRHVEVPSDGRAAGAPPYPLVDNPDTLLAVSDLVFVDPIGTGFSRVVAKGKSEDHWGVDEDAASVARFIRAYLGKHRRWASPKYLLGESYGGIRGPLLVRELQSGFDACALNGVILISPALDLAIVDGQSSDAAFATALPTYAATAWFHGALPERPADFDAFLDEVRGWVTAEYVPALFAGVVADDRHASLVAAMHRYTGISTDYIERARLRISTDRFRRELLRDRGLVVGRLDTRYTGTEPDDVGETPSGDPMAAGISGAYVAAFQSYLRGELEVDGVERDYVVMSEAAGGSWKRPKEKGAAFQGYVDVKPALARGMADNPDLRVFIGSGYYDIATTFFGAEYNVRRSTMDRARVVLKHYHAGHMMYVHEPTRVELSRDLRQFIGAGTSGAATGGAATSSGSVR